MITKVLHFGANHACNVMMQRAPVHANQTMVPAMLLYLGPTISAPITNTVSDIPPSKKPITIRRIKKSQKLCAKAVIKLVPITIASEGNRTIFLP